MSIGGGFCFVLLIISKAFSNVTGMVRLFEMLSSPNGPQVRLHLLQQQRTPVL